MKRKPIKHIIISRTDSIGDVVLTLPLAGLLKEKYPDCKITFLGSAYTRSVVALSGYVDAFLDWDEIRPLLLKEQVDRFGSLAADLIIHVYPVRIIGCIAKKAGIPLRMGTTNRWFHWISCNRLVPLSRRRSPLHEAQLNVKLIRSLTGISDIPLGNLSQYYGFKDPGLPGQEIEELFDQNRFNLIMHPKSKGSAREWGLENFKQLIGLMPSARFKILITGTAEEGKIIRESSLFEENPDVADLTGKLTLEELIRVINRADGLLAASTGPLHIAAALGKKAVGIYPPIRPMHPGRWAPIGPRASYLVKEKTCNDCRKNMECHCIREITPEQVNGHFAKIT
jgi:ADP-heptose:LPS heptosyltransferase